MKSLKIILVLNFLLLFILPPTHSQPARKAAKHKADSILNVKSEVYFSFEITGREEIHRFTKMVSIDNVIGNKVYAFANKKQFRNFLKTKRAFELLKNPVESPAEPEFRKEAMMRTTSVNAWNYYPTYSGYDSLMTSFQTNYPALCKVFIIGILPSGRKLIVAKITGNVNIRENKPQFLYTSTMHGNEPTGYVTMLHLVDYLLSNYGTDPRVTYLLNNIEIYINPLANPDGCYAGGNNTVSGGTRYNANHVDLNRNYPDPQAGAHPDGHAYQPETQAFMHFADSLYFTMSANFHTGAEVFNYPWDTWSALHADDNWWLRTGILYADTVQANSASGYFNDLYSGTNPGVTNGYAWYQVTGGRQDYMNYFKHCRECTIELSSTFIPNANTLLNYWNYNYRSLLNYLEQSLYGIRGVVTDSCTGQPLHAKVFITGHDHDSSHVYSNLPIGDYHRLIYSGNYPVTYSAPGYVSKTISNIHVANDSTTLVNVALSPVPPTASISATPTVSCPGPIQFTGPSSGTNWYWDFGDGDTSSLQNPFHDYNVSGTFTVKLLVSNCSGSDSLVLNQYITIFPVPAVPVASLLNDTLYSNASSGNQWYDNGNVINGATADFFVPLNNGNYTVTVSNGNGCASDTSNMISYITTGVYTQSDYDPGFKVYPNPSNGIITVHVQRPGKESTIEIIDPLGKVVRQFLLNKADNTFDLSELSPASYSLRYKTAGESHVQNLMIK